MPSFLPLNPAMVIFGHRGTLTLIPRSISNVDGFPRVVRGAPVEIKGVIHPASGRDLERLPEGLRDREVVQLFTSHPIDNGEETAGEGAPIVQYKPGKDAAPREYVIYRAEDWAAASSAQHVRCWCYRVL